MRNSEIREVYSKGIYNKYKETCYNCSSDKLWLAVATERKFSASKIDCGSVDKPWNWSQTPTLWDPMDYSPPGSSAHGILQARILELVAISFSRESSQPRDRTWVSCIAGRFITIWTTGEAHIISYAVLSHFSSVQFRHSVVSNFLWPHESQYTRPPCPSPTPGVHPNSCASSRWCHPAISSSVIPFSSCPQSLPASASFPMSQLFAWGGQSIGVSASASDWCWGWNQDWSPLGWTGWISLQSKGLTRVFSSTTAQKHQFFGAQVSSQSNSHIHTWPLEKP